MSMTHSASLPLPSLLEIHSLRNTANVSLKLTGYDWVKYPSLNLSLRPGECDFLLVQARSCAPPLSI